MVSTRKAASPLSHMPPPVGGDYCPMPHLLLPHASSTIALRSKDSRGGVFNVFAREPFGVGLSAWTWIAS